MDTSRAPRDTRAHSKDPRGPGKEMTVLAGSRAASGETGAWTPWCPVQNRETTLVQAAQPALSPAAQVSPGPCLLWALTVVQRLLPCPRPHASSGPWSQALRGGVPSVVQQAEPRPADKH